MIAKVEKTGVYIPIQLSSFSTEQLIVRNSLGCEGHLLPLDSQGWPCSTKFVTSFELMKVIS
ncbi:hypothetical protein [Parapedobacter lycopersici]|uniref:hypothetical protein n=1 Tax=Parapedobacter lycopersici TaxID=1864939 RepID=UPI00333E6B44